MTAPACTRPWWKATGRWGTRPARRRWPTEWLTFLEGEAAKAPNPDARAVFDSHRMAAAMVLGDPMRVVPAIEQSEKDLPSDYNPPARLANALPDAGAVG